MKSSIVTWLFGISLGLGVANAAAPLEPASKVYFGAWVDTAPGRDTPSKFNERMGIKASFFQLAQNLPLNFRDPLPYENIENTGTNAMLMLTVYPYDGLAAVTTQAIDDFVKQVAGWTKAGRSVFIRFAPEMNGSWFPWGQRPTAFISTWRAIVSAMRANPLTRDKVAFIWAPNLGFGYPYPNGQYSNNATTNNPDLALMDTNKNGRLDEGDDPYTPWYPGDEYVDWVGMSIYYFGNVFPWEKNELPIPSRFTDLITGANGNGGVDIYQKFSVERNKPFFITETGAAFHQNFLNNTPIPPGPGNVEIKRAFWREYITNPSVLQRYNRIKAICLFEYNKPEETTFRLFQVTNGSDVLAAFKEDFTKPDVLSQYIFASSGSSGTPSSNSASATTMQFGIYGLGSILLILSFSIRFLFLS